jgi:hypothetical protein
LNFGQTNTSENHAFRVDESYKFIKDYPVYWNWKNEQQKQQQQHHQVQFERMN